MAYLLLGIGLLIAFVLLARWFVSVEPRALLRIAKWSGLLLAGSVALFLTVTGRLGLAFTAAAVLAPWAVRWIERSRRAGRATGPGGAGSGRESQVATRFLRMSLSHDSGELDGEIIEGAHGGCRLSALDLDQVLDLLVTYRRQDASSAQLLEAYLDRHHQGWRDAGRAAGPSAADTEILSRGRMSREEAFRILGLGPGASEDEIQGAYRRLIAGLHPDRGGSPLLAALVNAARDILLRP